MDDKLYNGRAMLMAQKVLFVNNILKLIGI